MYLIKRKIQDDSQDVQRRWPSVFAPYFPFSLRSSNKTKFTTYEFTINHKGSFRLRRYKKSNKRHEKNCSLNLSEIERTKVELFVMSTWSMKFVWTWIATEKSNGSDRSYVNETRSREQSQTWKIVCRTRRKNSSSSSRASPAGYGRPSKSYSTSFSISWRG